MKPLWARLLAVAAGVSAFLLVLIVNFFGSLLLEKALRSQVWLQAAENYPLVSGYDVIGPVFMVGYPICVGVTTIFFFWKGWPTEGARLVLYLLVLGIVGPLTFINYLVSDQWLNLWIQTLFNLFVAFVGYTLVLKIRHHRAEAFDAKALQSLSVLTITSLLVALPLFYSAVFLAVAFGAVEAKDARLVGEGIPLAIAGGAGAVAAFLTHMDELRGTSSEGTST